MFDLLSLSRERECVFLRRGGILLTGDLDLLLGAKYFFSSSEICGGAEHEPVRVGDGPRREGSMCCPFPPEEEAECSVQRWQGKCVAGEKLMEASGHVTQSTKEGMYQWTKGCHQGST